MPRRHALPDLWLFTDDRQGDALWAAIKSLPKGRAGVVVRTAVDIDQIRAICRARRLLFILAGPEKLARAAKAHGSHGCHRGALTAPAHGRAEVIAAGRNGARLIFLSPVFPTRTHPGARALTPVRFGLIAMRPSSTMAALGGMTAKRYRQMRKLGAVAWGAIDALTKS